MIQRRVVLALLVALLAAPMASAQALPCADAYTASAEQIISTVRVTDLPGGAAVVLELMARFSIIAVNLGNAPVALTLLQGIENGIDNLVRTGGLDPVSGEAIIALVEQARAVLANCTATPPVVTLNCRSGDGENEVMWLNPPGTHIATRVLARTDTYPQGPLDPAARVVGTYPGLPGAVGQATDTGLANGLRYYYAAFAEDSSGESSPGRLTFGRPQSRDGAFRWSYTAGGASKPIVGGLFERFMITPSTGFVFALEEGADGGTWHSQSIPTRIPSPAPDRPIALVGSVTPTGEPWLIVSSLEGRVRALEADTGATIWTSPRIGDAVEASVCIMFSAYQGIDDVVMVGTVDRRGRGRFVGLDLADGSVSWSFDNGGGSGRLGPIPDSCTVDYGRQRVYFASEPGRRGSQDTVWALEIGEGSATKLWSAIYPNVNTAPVVSGEALYVGTSVGEVHAINVSDGSSRWTSPYATGDGPVQSFVFPQRDTGRLAFSTSSQVHLVQEMGTEAVPIWQPSIAMANPNVPLVVGDAVVVTDAEGQVFSLDATVARPAAVPFATFGDPALRAPPGLPYFDNRNGLYGVGTAEGVLYVVQTP